MMLLYFLFVLSSVANLFRCLSKVLGIPGPLKGFGGYVTYFVNGDDWKFLFPTRSDVDRKLKCSNGIPLHHNTRFHKIKEI